MDITIIVKAVIWLIFVILSVYVVPTVKKYLNSKLDTEDLKKLEIAVEIAVRAAEQIFRHVPDSGYEKKQYVLNLLKTEYGYSIDTDEIDAFVEAKVLELFGKGGATEL